VITLEQKILVWLDKKKISQPTIDKILQRKPGLEHLFDNYYVFSFDPVAFVEAELIHDKKRRNNDRLNFQRTLLALVNFFEHITSINDYALENHSTEDIKRDMENTGVGFSCLFMNKFLNVPWERITPIDMIEKRPDFIGISDEPRIYIFEAKGTMQPHKIASKFDEAETQKKADGLPPSDEKFSFVTFVPDKIPSFPSTIFVSDPLSSKIPPLDLKIVILMHYENVLYYAHLDKTRSLYSKVLKIEIQKRVSSSTSECDNGYPCNFESVKQKLRAAFNAEKQKMDSLQYSGIKFIGKSYAFQTDKKKFNVFCGVAEEIITSIINQKTEIQFVDTLKIVQDNQTAIFSDGSILHIDEVFDSEEKLTTNQLEKFEQKENVLQNKSQMVEYQSVANYFTEDKPKEQRLMMIRG
jgi:hypothetical protein